MSAPGDYDDGMMIGWGNFVFLISLTHPRKFILVVLHIGK
jgi:hypothetical protein